MMGGSVMKTAVFLSVGLLTLALSACSQNPAEIVYRGSNIFGRGHEEPAEPAVNQTFDANAPRYKPAYARPAEPAEVPVVNISDLPPPAPPSKPMQNQEPSAGGQQHVLRLNSEKTSSVEVQEQQVASISEKSPPAHKVVSEAKGDAKFIWPVEGGKIISRFDSGTKGNDGINIAMSEGEPIFASAGGTVVYAGNELRGYGNMVIIRHDGGFLTAYAHARSLAVKKGEKVKQSDLIAYVGSTGGVKIPQVHFAVRKGKTPVDPERYLPRNG
jgi:murein DD-endopeptidase MepM/ murein hydrolase activator NlpD